MAEPTMPNRVHWNCNINVGNLKMRLPAYVAVLATLLCLSGCLGFGKDEQSTNPTGAQVAKARAILHLNPALKLAPLGYKYSGSGIDDALWFKFETAATDPADIFDTKVVDVTRLKAGYKLPLSADTQWWDAEGKNLLGAELEFPDPIYMHIGIEKASAGCIVYVAWFET